jgi:AAA+ superfamily predicted ATPase
MVAARDRGQLRLLDEGGARGTVELGEGEILDMVWAGGRLWALTDSLIAAIGRDGALLGARDLPGGGGALLPASGEEKVVVAGVAPRRVHLESGSLRDTGLGALEPGETILASLGGLRTLRARGDEIRAVDPSRVVCRLRLPGAGIPVAASEILEGGAVAIARSSGEGLVIDVVRLPGGRVHHLELDGALRVAFAPDRGLAVASSATEIVAVDLRYGRVTHRIEAPLPGCHLDIDDRGETVALAATPAGSDRLSVFLVPFAELFAGAKLRFPEPERTLKSPRPEASGPRLVPAAGEPAEELEPVALPTGPLRALMLPAPPRPTTAPSGARSYADPREHLGDLLELARVLAARSIARAWDRGALAAPNPGARPGELELRVLAGEGEGDARAEIERWTARARDLEDEISARAEATLAGGGRLPLIDIAAQLELSPVAVRILVAVLAPALCPEAARLYGALAADSARPLCDRALVMQLLAGFDWRWRERVAAELAPDRPLLACGLIEPTAPGPGGELFAALTIEGALIERLRDELVESSPGGATTLVRADRDLEALAIPRSIMAGLVATLSTPGDRPVRIVVRGRAGQGRTSLLAALAAHAGRPLALIDAERLPGDDLAASLRRELVRASLRGAIPCVSGLEGHRDRDAQPGELARLRAVLAAFAEPIAFRAEATGELPLEPGFLSVTLPTLSETERLDHWREAAARAGLGASGLESLARRLRVGPGTIERVVAEVAASEQPGDDATTVLEAAARQRIASGLGAVATRVERLARIEQVALPPETLDSIHELIARARHRRIVLEGWGFGELVTSSRGLTALFSGPPGTGKTMVAGAIARELGLDLFRVDLARVTSKWIGETEKNLGRIFDAAEDGQAVILFDEADSLFARRTAVKSSIDRHSNMEVNYLLQRLDSFEGIAILTTNQASAIDGAFRRRLSLRLAFPFPDEDTRLDLWRAHLPEATPTHGDLDLATLARKFPMTGGYIRNSILRAAFLAAAEEQPLTREHLLRAVHLEYSDMGKLAAGGRLE